MITMRGIRTHVLRQLPSATAGDTTGLRHVGGDLGRTSAEKAPEPVSATRPQALQETEAAGKGSRKIRSARSLTITDALRVFGWQQTERVRAEGRQGNRYATHARGLRRLLG